MSHIEANHRATELAEELRAAERRRFEAIERARDAPRYPQPADQVAQPAVQLADVEAVALQAGLRPALGRGGDRLAAGRTPAHWPPSTWH